MIREHGLTDNSINKNNYNKAIKQNENYCSARI